MKKIKYLLALLSLMVVPVCAQTSQYAYDANGNLIKDLSQGITKIEYNFLNLPSKVVWSSSRYSEYTYDAGGNKLRARHVDGSSVTTMDYCGNFVYENGALKRILIEGGYVENGEYYYYLNDHLGNNRVVAKADGTVVQTNDYYPFGGTLASTGDNVQPYKFGGKELDRTNGLNLYDFEARQYDARLGRFTTMDPMAEKYYSISPYAYCNNNPVKFTDPTGKTIQIPPTVMPMPIVPPPAYVPSAQRPNNPPDVQQMNRDIRQFVGGKIDQFKAVIIGTAAAISLPIIDLATNNDESKDGDTPGSDNRTADDPLRKDKDGNKVPDAEAAGAPHSQLGTRKGKYRQAREFDEKGNPVRDIDFTDHGRPQNHPNPHQHRYKDNPTGGTKQRNKLAEPLN